MANEVILDPEFGVFVTNSSDVATSEVLRAFGDQAPEIAALARWSAATQGFGHGRSGNLWERDKFVTPAKIYDQMVLSQYVAEHDDVVSGVLESTEALAFNRMDFFCEDPDEEDVWNQIAADLDLDSRLREMWRELFSVSQFYVGIWWGQKSYRVRGKTDKGNAKRREFKNLRVPTALTMLDPLKIVPIGLPMFNKERLAWIADRNEVEIFNRVIEDPTLDPLLARMLVGPYTPEREELTRINNAGFTAGRLFELNPNTVFRHTATRPQYQFFATPRLLSIMELLDMKHQLKGMDRAHLIGGTNFIVVITKGSDQLPAKPAEIANLQAQVQTVARVPVLVGDHRLKVEIVTPKLDTTLTPERYNTVDSRITARLYQMFVLGNYSAGASSDDSVKLMKVVARGMESRRQMIKRSLERFIFQPTMDRNPNTLTEKPTLRFHPRQIALDFDANFASFLLDLRAQNDISRETTLSMVDLDQDDEYRYLQKERDKYDDVFQTQVPFAAPNPAGGQPGVPGKPGQAAPAPIPVVVHGPDGKPVAPVKTSPAAKKAAGRRTGGNRNGGGSAPGTGQGQAPRNPRKKSDRGRPKPTAASEEPEFDELGDDDEGEIE